MNLSQKKVDEKELEDLLKDLSEKNKQYPDIMQKILNEHKEETAKIQRFEIKKERKKLFCNI